MFGKRATMFFQIVPGILIQMRILVETEHSIELYLIRKISSGFRYCSQCCSMHLPVVPHCSSRKCLPWLFDSICGWLQQPGVLCQIHSSCSLHWLLCGKCAHWGGGGRVMLCYVQRLAALPFISPLILFEITELPVWWAIQGSMIQFLNYPGCSSCTWVIGHDVRFSALDVSQWRKAIFHDHSWATWSHLNNSETSIIIFARCSFLLKSLYLWKYLHNTCYIVCQNGPPQFNEKAPISKGLTYTSYKTLTILILDLNISYYSIPWQHSNWNWEIKSTQRSFFYRWPFPCLTFSSMERWDTNTHACWPSTPTPGPPGSPGPCSADQP